MWVYNNLKWEQKKDSLAIDDFQNLRVEFESIRFYSKCLSGSVYLPINDMENIYDSLNNNGDKSWYIDITQSIIADTDIPTIKPHPINNDTLDKYKKHLYDYSLTIKNKFTPYKTIKETLKNFIYVDAATTSELTDLDGIVNSRIIDGITLVNNSLVLVKDQKSRVILDVDINPDEYFLGEYTILNQTGTDTEYEFYNNENGIYRYDNGLLVRENLLTNYEDAVRLSISVKQGNINREIQYHLSRLRNGLFPTGDEPMHFKLKKNWLLKNRIDYNNVLDINYNDILVHDELSYSIGDINYTIPKRVIAIGEFGLILNYQSDIANIIPNKYKVILRSISQTTQYYWIVGDDGVVLKIRKHDFLIERVFVDCLCPDKKITSNLKGINFFDDLYGAIVGELNTILITEDGGITWKRKLVSAFAPNNYNAVVWSSPNNMFVVGNNGVFINIRKEMDEWVVYKRRISKFIDDEDEFVLVDNLNDIIIVGDLVVVVGNESNIITHPIIDTNSFTDFNFLEIGDYGDIENIISDTNGNIYFTGYSGDLTLFGVFKTRLDYYTIYNNQEESNIITSTYSIINISNEYPTSMRILDNQVYLSGNNSMLRYGDLETFTLSDLDTTLSDRLKSKFLILDYDIATKVNFFTDDGEYRLPNSITVNPESILVFSALDNERNWWDYWGDSISTFEYYAQVNPMTDDTKITPLPIFTIGSVSIEIVTISNSLTDILPLSPNIDNFDHSRFNGFGHPLPQEPTEIYDLYLYGYLGILRYEIGTPMLEGDSINFFIDGIIDVVFTINKIVYGTTHNYAYFITNFTEGVIKSIIDAPLLIIKNINYFADLDDLAININKHPIGLAYKAELIDDGLKISAKYSIESAYYNLATKVEVDGVENIMKYEDSFIQFGYSPTYNILNYLENISIDFNEDKEYLSMPIYIGIPYASSILNNKIYIGNDYKFEWETFFINTFIDIKVRNGNNEYIYEQLLIVDKYYQEVNNIYIIEIHKSIVVPNGVTEFDLISRRKLGEISNDLNFLNNIQKNPINKSYTGGTIESMVLWDVNYTTYSDYLDFKPNTDSYAKIILSDAITRRTITAVLYTDIDNELSINVVNLDVGINIPILNTQNYDDKLLIMCSEEHGLGVGDGVVLEFSGGTNSSQFINQQYFGYRVATPIDLYNFIVDLPYGDIPFIGNDIGIVKYIRTDPYFNYQPVDLIDVGVDKKNKIAIELLPNNVELINGRYRLLNIDYNKLRFRLVGDADIENLSKSFTWVLEADISNAVIGIVNRELLWYSGIWNCGRWFGGIWYSGTWISGDWYSGTWNSLLVDDNITDMAVNNNFVDEKQSIWRTGRWFSGTWNGGTWYRGRWYGGIWNSGKWYDGIWNGGTWNGGNFTGGVWVNGLWNLGIFGAINAPAYWIDGEWNGGDFENGMWFDGVFDAKNGESRFGTMANNNRAAIWLTGRWKNGSFHSKLNLTIDGRYDVSQDHKHAIWYTGTWLRGNFYGGVAYNINFMSGIWYGGIIGEIKIIGMGSEDNRNFFLLEGLFSYRIGTNIHIIDDGLGGVYESYGSNETPKTYTVLYSEQVSGNTKVYINAVIVDDVTSMDIPLRAVSKFENANWKSGIWSNGIYQSGLWEGGIWYNGVFYATWT